MARNSLTDNYHFARQGPTMSTTQTFEAATIAPAPSFPWKPLDDWHKATVRDLPAAKQLLDRLKAEGYEQRRLSVAGTLVVVRWR